MNARRISTANGTANVESANMSAGTLLTRSSFDMILNSALAITIPGTIWAISNANSTDPCRLQLELSHSRTLPERR